MAGASLPLPPRRTVVALPSGSAGRHHAGSDLGQAAAPEPTEITPALIAAARREGQVVYYTSLDLPVSERLARTFEAQFPGMAVRVERSGAERVFQRIGQEYASNVHAVD